MNTAKPRYRRVLIKLSGEAMAGGSTASKGLGINPGDLRDTAAKLADAASTGTQLVVIPGGGNIVRGGELATDNLLRRDTADHMGMLGTVINALALRDALEAAGRPAAAMSALPVPPHAPAFDRRAAEHLLDRGHTLIVAAGVGQPFFTTDSGAALRAAELACDALVKATKVDGVYDDDPAKNPAAKRFDTLSITEAIDRRLRVMDLSALTLCEQQGIDIAVCDFHTPGNLTRMLQGETVGTVITAR